MEFAAKYAKSDVLHEELKCFICENGVSAGNQTECIYRLVICPGRNCKSQVPFHELLEHMKMNKAILPEEAVKMTFREKKAFSSKKFLAMIEIESKTFLTCLTISKGFTETGMIHYWIYFVGSPQEAKHYSYTLECQNEEGTTKNTFDCQVVSIDETADSIIRNGNCLNIIFSKFSRRDEQNMRVIKHTVTIRNLKEEAKDENVESGISDNDE